MRKVTQVRPHDAFPSGEGWDVGVLKLLPEEIATRFGIAFERGLDDLDYYSLAAVQDDAVGQVWLMMHDRTPMPGTGVMVDASVSRRDALRAVSRQLGLDSADFLWITEYECNPLLDAILGATRPS